MTEEASTLQGVSRRRTLHSADWHRFSQISEEIDSRIELLFNLRKSAKSADDSLAFLVLALLAVIKRAARIACPTQRWSSSFSLPAAALRLSSTLRLRPEGNSNIDGHDGDAVAVGQVDHFR